MLLVNAQNCLEVSNEDYSQSRCPILVCPITLAAETRKKKQPAGIPLCRWQRALAEPKPRVRTGSWY